MAKKPEDSYELLAMKTSRGEYLFGFGLLALLLAVASLPFIESHWLDLKGLLF